MPLCLQRGCEVARATFSPASRTPLCGESSSNSSAGFVSSRQAAVACQSGCTTSGGRGCRKRVALATRWVRAGGKICSISSSLSLLGWTDSTSRYWCSPILWSLTVFCSNMCVTYSPRDTHWHWFLAELVLDSLIHSVRIQIRYNERLGLYRTGQGRMKADMQPWFYRIF